MTVVVHPEISTDIANAHNNHSKLHEIMCPTIPHRLFGEFFPYFIYVLLRNGLDGLIRQIDFVLSLLSRPYFRSILQRRSIGRPSEKARDRRED